MSCIYPQYVCKHSVQSFKDLQLKQWKQLITQDQSLVWTYVDAQY
jgi:hypothetical protein